MQRVHVSNFKHARSYTDCIFPDQVLARDTKEDRVRFLNAAFTAYASIVRSLEPSEGYESLMVAVFLFTGKSSLHSGCDTGLTRISRAGLLKEEQSIDVVGGTLGSFKGLLDQASHLASDVSGFGRLVHSVLSSVLNNIDDMRQVPLNRLPVRFVLIARH